MKKINTSHLVAFVFTLYIFSSFFIFSGCKPDDIDIIQPKDSVVLEVITENYSIDWTKKFGAEKGDRFGDAAQTEDGDIIVVSITDTTYTEMGCLYDGELMNGLLHLTKLDSRGNIIWKKRYDSLYRQFNGLFTFGATILSTINGYSINLSHTDNNTKCPKESNFINSIFNFSEDGEYMSSIILSYEFANPATAYSKSRIVEDGILSIDAHGFYHYPDYSNGRRFCVSKMGFDGVLIFAECTEYGSFVPCNSCGDSELISYPEVTNEGQAIAAIQNQEGLYFLKYDRNGAILLEKKLVENIKSLSQYESSVHVGNDGNYLIKYEFLETHWYPPPTYLLDIIGGEIKLDTEGNRIWEIKRSLDSLARLDSNGDEIWKLQIDKNVRYIYSESDGTVFNVEDDKVGAYQMKLDNSGEEVWKRQYITNFEPLTSGGTLPYKNSTPDGGYLAGGNSNKLEEGRYGQLDDYNKLYENLYLAKYKKD